ncbi:LytTR family DNA-binding domain-containing protein [Fulvivirgaceae bacterium PWU4]|uniref:LytTR family DNA-binding domain-containing protein n=1 Tax=Chryseosolibacter histidini TaxID=2782349 RepID=A0AAP2DPT2_9BACT|nr:LytTR family DNA-binding domain-containing protein [Chryseosolibacter histidini]MBT1698084.1 LytTR family DNA-binding domain-containing protein [Chryseosolibacter histidini]
MLKSIIIDDELKSRESLKKLLLTYCPEATEVNATCQNITEGMEAIYRFRPDIVFLDVQMQGETGFDLLTKFKRVDFEVIFTTAHAEYALQAIKFSAIDYLLKPVDIEDLRNAIAKVERKQNANIAFRMQHLLQNLKVSNKESYKLALPTAEGLTFISVSQITYCKASGNYTEIFMTGGTKYLVCRQLKEYDDLLFEHDFFRIHHSYLINLNHVKNYVKGDGGYVVMTDDATIDVSRRKKESFLDRIGYRS